MVVEFVFQIATKVLCKSSMVKPDCKELMCDGLVLALPEGAKRGCPI